MKIHTRHFCLKGEIEIFFYRAEASSDENMKLRTDVSHFFVESIMFVDKMSSINMTTKRHLVTVIGNCNVNCS